MEKKGMRALLVWAAVLSACSTAPAVSTGKVSGTLQSRDASRPVDFAGTVVSVAGKAVQVSGQGSVQYSVDGIAIPGTYPVLVTVPGSKEGSLQASVTIDSGSAAANFTFGAPDLLGTLSGKVTGLPSYTDAIVAIEGHVTLPNGTDGTYSFAGIPYGAYVVSVTSPSSAEKHLTVPVTLDAPAKAAPDVAFTAAAIRLSGIVRLFPGTPVAGTRLTLGGQQGVAPVVTDANGIYSFAGVNGGSNFSITVTSGSYSDTIPSVTFQPLVGGFVQDRGAVYNLAQAPFELQAGHRIVTTDSNADPIPVAVSPDASVVAYLVPSGDTRGGGGGEGLRGTAAFAAYCPTVYTLYLAETLGTSPPVPVDSRVAGCNQTVRFSQDGRWVAYSSLDASDTWQLLVAPVPSGGQATYPVVVADRLFEGKWDFSPVLNGTPTVYAFVNVWLGEGGFVPRLREISVPSGLVINSTDAMPEFAQTGFLLLPSRKNGTTPDPRIIYVDSGSYLYSVPCTGAPVDFASWVLVDSTLTTAAPSITVSADQAEMAYVNPVSTPAGPGQGLKKGPTNAASVLIDSGVATGGTGIQISGDNAKVAYSSAGGLYVSGAVGPSGPVYLGANPVNAADGTLAAFSNDSSQIVYLVDDPAVTINPPKILFVGPLDPGAATRVATSPTDYLVSPDGRRIVFSTPTSAPGGSGVDYFSRTLGGAPIRVALAVQPGAQFTPDSTRLLLTLSRNYQTGTFDLGYTPVDRSGNAVTIAQAVVQFVPEPDPATSRVLVLTRETSAAGSSNGSRVYSFSSGSLTPLVGYANYRSTWLYDTTRSKPDRVLSPRVGSPPPYSFQDGLYVSGVP